VADLRDDYHWHPTPMFVEELAIFGRKDSGRTDMTLAALEGHRVGYTIGYTYPLAFRQNPRILKAAAKSDRQLLEMLDARRVDYILINTAPAWLRLARGAQACRARGGDLAGRLLGRLLARVA